MTDDYFQLSLDVVQVLVRAQYDRPVKLNEIQCKLLLEKLVETVSSVQVILGSLAPAGDQASVSKPPCEAALLELYRIVINAAEIIHACCSQDWLKAAVKFASATKAFAKATFDLDWVTDVFRTILWDARLSDRCYVSDSIELGFTATDQPKRHIGAVIHDELSEAALRDFERLRGRLNDMRDSGMCVGELERQRVENVLKSIPNVGNKKSTEDLHTIHPQELVNIKSIGRGTAGEVFEVRWLGQRFARKFIPGKMKIIFQQEVASLVGLSHPNIVKVFGVSSNSQGKSIVMELMDADLRAYMEARMKFSKQAPFGLAVALDILLQIAEGVEYLHKHQRVHRDIKSTNILVNLVQDQQMAKAGYLQAKVADFSLANVKPKNVTSMPTYNVGSTQWMAPELIRVHNANAAEERLERDDKTTPVRNLDLNAADVYSYAITCYEILTGKLPFKAKLDPCELKLKIKFKNVRPHLPDSLPPYLVTLIKRSWNSDARKRPTFSHICTELRHLKAVLMRGTPFLTKTHQPLQVSRDLQVQVMFSAFQPCLFIRGGELPYPHAYNSSCQQAPSLSYSLLHLQSLSHLDLSNF
jgi:serine/threonine protein kinase